MDVILIFNLDITYTFFEFNFTEIQNLCNCKITKFKLPRLISDLKKLFKMIID